MAVKFVFSICYFCVPVGRLRVPDALIRLRDEGEQMHLQTLKTGICILSRAIEEQAENAGSERN